MQNPGHAKNLCTKVGKIRARGGVQDLATDGSQLRTSTPSRPPADPAGPPSPSAEHAPTRAHPPTCTLHRVDINSPRLSSSGETPEDDNLNYPPPPLPGAGRRRGVPTPDTCRLGRLRESWGSSLDASLLVSGIGPILPHGSQGLTNFRGPRQRVAGVWLRGDGPPPPRGIRQA